LAKTDWQGAADLIPGLVKVCAMDMPDRRFSGPFFPLTFLRRKTKKRGLTAM